MAIAFIEEPELVSDVTRPIVFKTKSDDYIGLPGVPFVGKIRAYETLHNVNRFTFHIPGETVVMTGVSSHTSPPNPNHFLVVKRQYFVLGNADRVALAQDFARNPILNKHYIIEPDHENAKIVFTARMPGSSSNPLSPGGWGQFDHGQLGVDATRVNFEITFDLFFRKQDGSPDFKKIHSSKLVHNLGIASIDVSKMIDDALSVVSPDQVKIDQPLQSQLQGEYYCVATEQYGNPAKPQNSSKSSIKRATKQLLVSKKNPLPIKPIQEPVPIKPTQEPDTLTIKLIQQPEMLSFSGNPMIFKLQSWLYLDSPGIAFIGALCCKQVFAPGTKICFSFSDERIEMGAVLKPDESGDQFPADTDSSPKLSANTLAPFFIANYKLNKHYLIEAKDDTIVFIARKAGVFYNWRKDPFLVTRTLGVDLKERENFKFLFELFFKKTGAVDFENIYSEQIIPDTPFSGIATIDVSKNIDAFLEHKLPNFKNEMFTCSTSKGEYYCQFGEIYGHTPKIQKISKSGVKHVIKGGLSYMGKAKKVLDILSPDKNDTSKDRFLKQGGRVIKVREPLFEKLYFINSRATTSKIQMVIHITYVDKTTSIAKTSLFDINLYDKVLFYPRIEFSSSKKIKEYNCRLVNQNNETVSETITYQIDNTYRERVRYFAYTSSWGSIDVFAAFGEGSEEYELSGKTATKYADYNYRTHYNIRLQRKFKVSTGWLNKSRFDLLADFFLAEKKWILSDDGTALPISVNTQKAGLSHDKNPLLAQAFEYQYDFDDDKYTDGDI